MANIVLQREFYKIIQGLRNTMQKRTYCTNSKDTNSKDATQDKSTNLPVLVDQKQASDELSIIMKLAGKDTEIMKLCDQLHERHLTMMTLYDKLHEDHLTIMNLYAQLESIHSTNKALIATKILHEDDLTIKNLYAQLEGVLSLNKALISTNKDLDNKLHAEYSTNKDLHAKLKQKELKIQKLKEVIAQLLPLGIIPISPRLPPRSI